MQRCPLCQSTRFKAINKRRQAECAWCGARERTRMIGLGLDQLPENLPAGPFLHFAPEEALYSKLRRKLGDRYTPCDIRPADFKLFPVPVKRIDITSLLDFHPAESLSGILHSHVVEKSPGDPAAIMTDMNRALAPGGVHLFVVSVDPDFDAARFEAQYLSRFDGFRRMPLADLIHPADLFDAAIPEDTLTTTTSNTLFGFVKD